MKDASTNRLWNLSQVKLFVKSAKDRVGRAGWEYLSDEMREGLIAREFAMVLVTNSREAIPQEAIECLYREMLTVAGLITPAAGPDLPEEPDSEPMRA